MTRTALDNATEFNQLTKQGRDARLALLVACSVDPTSKGGRPATGADAPVTGKISASAFARTAGTTKDRVLRHLAAWDKVANSRDKLVPLSSTLKPASAEKFGVVSVEAQAAFAALYREIVKEQNAPAPEPEPVNTGPAVRTTSRSSTPVDDAVEHVDSRYTRVHAALVQAHEALTRAVQEALVGESTEDEVALLRRDVKGIGDALTNIVLAVGGADWDREAATLEDRS